MLRKFNRRKTPRKNFSVDTVYQGLLLDKATPEEKTTFVDNKVARKDFDDDRFCNMLLQKDKMMFNKLLGHQTKRLYPFYPSFIPIVDKKHVLSHSEYYWTSNTIEYKCIRCGNPTISFLGDFSLKNVICGHCIEDYYINKKGIFDKRLHEHEYSKFRQNFYQFNKDHLRQVFKKLLKRERSMYIDTDIHKSLKISYTKNLKGITQMFNSLIE